MPTKKKTPEAKSTQKRKTLNLKDLQVSSKGLDIRGGTWSRDNGSVSTKP
jgi:hypothetical protein